jgi:hypothetical protein
MIKAGYVHTVIIALTVLTISDLTMSPASRERAMLLQPALAAPDQSSTEISASKTISFKALEQYTPISVTLEEDGKQVTYTGVPLRVLLAEMVPDVKLESMPGWKALSRRELVMEVTGDDGYPGLVTAIEIAINKSGDRFVLATHRDGKPIDSGVRLICRMDEARTRCVRQLVSLRVVTVAKKLSLNVSDQKSD